ncbi:hypothetical protein ACG04R_16365 [Roseateles sp. BYS78W]|uniref:Uncharacterized protein n=1 Tax=Pelomonas candidula TaxID=3299025 RepID=A0ABW7HEK5_9BURK
MSGLASIDIDLVPWESDWMSVLGDDSESQLCVGQTEAGFHSGLRLRRESGEFEVWWSEHAKPSIEEAQGNAYQRLLRQVSQPAREASPESVAPTCHQSTVRTREMNMSHIARTVAVLSGEDTNVGKSTIARHMLRPGLTAVHGSCEYLLVEKVDRDIAEGEDKRYRPEELKAISLKLAMCRAKKKGAVVVDVGGGQASAFLAEMKQAQGSEARIDAYIVPVVATMKIDKIIETIEELILIGVPADKLSVVINRAPVGKTVADLVGDGTFKPLADHAAEYGYRLISIALPNNPAVERVRHKVSLTLGALADGTADLNAEFERLVAEGKDDEAADVFDLEYDGGYAKSMRVHMDSCFSEIFGIPMVSGLEVSELDA